jgi:leucyl-tRNA synthetase
MLPADKKEAEKVKNFEYCYYKAEDGIIQEPAEFKGMTWKEVREPIIKYIEKKGFGFRKTNFKLRDWGVSRQRYWGTPIPVIHCEKCGAVPVPEKDLPVELPKNVEFGKGNPLETNEKWLKVKCPKCGGKGRRESDTMDTFANSSWYFLRYCDPANDKKIFDRKKVKYWCPVDTYIGGAEHACMHLIYSRFYVKFLRDLGLVDFDEPAIRLFHQGMINDEKGEKMSKSKGNVVEPLETMAKYGVDTTRYFLLSMASPDKGFNWSDKEIAGSQRFVRKVFEFYDKSVVMDMGDKIEDDSRVLSKLNWAIKGVGEDIENMELRAATIKLKELFNFLAKEEMVSVESRIKALKLLAPFCPHVCEEIWEKLGGKDFVSVAKWPKLYGKEEWVGATVVLDINIKLIQDINRIVNKYPDKKNVYVYVMPFEVDKVDVGKIGEGVGKDVKVFSVGDPEKYDPENKARKARPGMAAIYVE